jgi:galactitol-specific phosphotransferase system IIC component
VKKRTEAKDSTIAAAVTTMKRITRMMMTGMMPIKRKLKVVFGKSNQMKKMNGMNKEALMGISTKMTNHKMIMMPVTMMKRKVTPARKRAGGQAILGVMMI